MEHEPLSSLHGGVKFVAQQIAAADRHPVTRAAGG